MMTTKFGDALCARGQIELCEIGALAAAGHRSIICTRPDGEVPGQPGFEAIAAEAARHDMACRYIPVAMGAISAPDIAAFVRAIDELPKPILAYCGSGRRSAALFKAAAIEGVASALPPPAATAKSRMHRAVVIVGGGAAGIAVATSLRKRARNLEIAIIEPSNDHFYQPGWTMVGAGIFEPETTRRATASVIPAGVEWIQSAVATFDPPVHEVTLTDGRSISYDKLVVCAGLELDWGAIEGLSETLGHNGVTSNYRHDLAPYTWRLVKGLKVGVALFTQPPMPIKCAGAPQKAMYLSCDSWRRSGDLGAIDVEFLNAGPVLFGVPDYVPPLMEYVKSYGIALSFGHRLVGVDGDANIARFKTADGTIVERRFDMLHVVPPQKPLAFIASSPIAGQGGWIDVDPATLRHHRFPDVYALGDATDTPNAKTAAAVRKQAPVVAENLLRDMVGAGIDAIYDGYGSCPLTVERGRIVLAEFAYGGRRVPSFPKWLIDDLEPSRLAWHLKVRALPAIYWQAMLKGREMLAKPKRGT